MNDSASTSTCPLCSAAFSTDTHCDTDNHSGCPMASHCALIRCPRCGYEFPDSNRSVVARWLSRWLKSDERPERT